MAAKATRSIKVKESEDLSSSNIEKVISLLSATPPITKKDACSLLRIAYNTTRLSSIIDNYLAKKEKEKEIRAQKAYTPATETEISYTISSYLSGEPVQHIADSLYRSAGFVDRILDTTGTPRRSQGWSYFAPKLIPEEAIRESFETGEKVWSSRYESLATIKEEILNQPHPTKVYAIYLEDENWQQYAYQPTEELASLSHLTKYGVVFK